MLVLCIAACLLFPPVFCCAETPSSWAPGYRGGERSSSASQGASPEVSAVASRLDEVEKMLSSGSLDSYDADAATRAVLDSFLKNTDDAYARYFDDARYTSFVDVATDEYPGVGVFFSGRTEKRSRLMSSRTPPPRMPGFARATWSLRSMAIARRGLDGNGDHQRRSARGRLVGCYHLVAAFDVRWLRRARNSLRR